MLSYGCTRLELGLQSIYEDVARDTNRGHSVAAVQDCFKLAKDAGFKVTAVALTLLAGGPASQQVGRTVCRPHAGQHLPPSPLVV